MTDINIIIIDRLGKKHNVIAPLDMSMNIMELIKSNELADDASANRLIWKDGNWHALPSGLWTAITTPLFRMRDKIRVLGEPFRKKGDNPNEDLDAELLRRYPIPLHPKESLAEYFSRHRFVR